MVLMISRRRKDLRGPSSWLQRSLRSFALLLLALLCVLQLRVTARFRAMMCKVWIATCTCWCHSCRSGSAVQPDVGKNWQSRTDAIDRVAEVFGLRSAISQCDSMLCCKCLSRTLVIVSIQVTTRGEVKLWCQDIVSQRTGPSHGQSIQFRRWLRPRYLDASPCRIDRSLWSNCTTITLRQSSLIRRRRSMHSCAQAQDRGPRSR